MVHLADSSKPPRFWEHWLAPWHHWDEDQRDSEVKRNSLQRKLANRWSQRGHFHERAGARFQAAKGSAAIILKAFPQLLCQISFLLYIGSMLGDKIKPKIKHIMNEIKLAFRDFDSITELGRWPLMGNKQTASNLRHCYMANPIVNRACAIWGFYINLQQKKRPYLSGLPHKDR